MVSSDQESWGKSGAGARASHGRGLFDVVSAAAIITRAYQKLVDNQRNDARLIVVFERGVEELTKLLGEPKAEVPLKELIEHSTGFSTAINSEIKDTHFDIGDLEGLEVNYSSLALTNSTSRVSSLCTF